MVKRDILLVGAGLIGRRHVPYIQSVANLIAIVDPDPSAVGFAEDLAIPLFPTLEDALEAHTIDGAILATPNHLHVPQAVMLVERGIPCLIEKPIADQSVSASRLVALAEDKAVPLLIGHHRRHNTLIQRAKGVMEQGLLGELVAARANFWLYKPDDYFNQEWRTKAGAGPAFINAIHDLDLLRYLCGEVSEVQAMQSHAQRGFEVEDTLIANLRFENGALGTVSISDTIVAPWSWEFTAGENPAYPKVDGYAYTLGGTRASLSIPDLKLWSHPGRRSWWEPIETKSLDYQPNDPLATQMQHFVDVMNGAAEPLINGRDALASLELLERIQAACRNADTT